MTMTMTMAMAMTLVLALSVDVARANSGSNSAVNCPKAIWAFGDSITDTGNSQATFPEQSRLEAPYGMSYTFTDKPGRNRYSDGRLPVDFFVQAFNFPFLGTYAHALNGANYARGANFAYAGARANQSTTITPFYLRNQVAQFLNFKSVALNPYYNKGGNQPVRGAFSEGGYFIPTIGGNDFFVASILAGLSSPVVIASFVPPAAAEVRAAITTLHASGARLFFLGNTPPQGCNPAQLTSFASSRPLDSLGCLIDINEINQDYNAKLQEVVNDLQALFSGDGTKIYLFDVYSATVEILTNKAAYGFTNTNQACCGAGGPYNYNSAFTCGGIGSCCPNFTPCATPESYISWDGIHYTQAFYRTITRLILNGRFVSPALNLARSCDLDFSKF